MVGTNPDLEYYVWNLAKFGENRPAIQSVDVQRGFKYILSTKHSGLRYGRPDETLVPIACVDEDCAGNITTSMSLRGLLVMMHGAAVFWAAQSQEGMALFVLKLSTSACVLVSRKYLELRDRHKAIQSSQASKAWQPSMSRIIVPLKMQRLYLSAKEQTTSQYDSGTQGKQSQVAIQAWGIAVVMK